MLASYRSALQAFDPDLDIQWSNRHGKYEITDYDSIMGERYTIETVEFGKLDSVQSYLARLWSMAPHKQGAKAVAAMFAKRHDDDIALREKMVDDEIECSVDRLRRKGQSMISMFCGAGNGAEEVLVSDTRRFSLVGG